MSGRGILLERLQRSANKAVERTVELALAAGAAPARDDLVDLLLARDTRSGWTILVRQFDRLSTAAKNNIRSHTAALYGPLAEAVGDDQGSGRLNVIAIVRETADGRLLALLPDALSDARPAVRRDAAEVLMAAARNIVNDPIESPNSRTLAAAVVKALRIFRHHKEPAIIAAALLLETQLDAAVWSLFTDYHGEAARAGQLALRQIDHPAMVRPAYLALASPLKSAALRGLAAPLPTPVAAAVIEQSFRLLDPKLRHAALGHTQYTLLQASTHDALMVEHPFGYLRLIEHLDLLLQERIALLHKFVTTAAELPLAGAKLTVLRILAEINTADTLPALAELLCDENLIVANAALRTITRRPMTEWRALLPTLLDTPHETIRATLRGLAARSHLERVWDRLENLPPALQRTAARNLSANQTAFVADLHARLGGSISDSAMGLKLLRSLEDLTPFNEVILQLARHADGRIAALAVKLLVRLDDPAIQSALEAAASHADGRVRSSAVEAMAERHIAQHSQRVLAMLQSPHNRERANAIRALSDFDYTTACDCLQKMLLDPNPLHRMSALWVVKQMKGLAVLTTIAELARRDPSPRVRRQALEVVGQWSLHAALPAGALA